MCYHQAMRRNDSEVTNRDINIARTHSPCKQQGVGYCTVNEANANDTSIEDNAGMLIQYEVANQRVAILHMNCTIVRHVT